MDTAAAGLFNLLDRNQDGVISRSEFGAAFGGTQQPRPQTAPQEAQQAAMAAQPAPAQPAQPGQPQQQQPGQPQQQPGQPQPGQQQVFEYTIDPGASGNMMCPPVTYEYMMDPSGTYLIIPPEAAAGMGMEYGGMAPYPYVADPGALGLIPLDYTGMGGAPPFMDYYPADLVEPGPTVFVESFDGLELTAPPITTAVRYAPPAPARYLNPGSQSLPPQQSIPQPPQGQRTPLPLMREPIALGSGPVLPPVAPQPVMLPQAPSAPIRQTVPAPAPTAPTPVTVVEPIAAAVQEQTSSMKPILLNQTREIQQVAGMLRQLQESSTQQQASSSAAVAPTPAVADAAMKPILLNQTREMQEQTTMLRQLVAERAPVAAGTDAVMKPILLNQTREMQEQTTMLRQLLAERERATGAMPGEFHEQTNLLRQLLLRLQSGSSDTHDANLKPIILNHTREIQGLKTMLSQVLEKLDKPQVTTVPVPSGGNSADIKAITAMLKEVLAATPQPSMAVSTVPVPVVTANVAPTAVAVPAQQGRSETTALLERLTDLVESLQQPAQSVQERIIQVPKVTTVQVERMVEVPQIIPTSTAIIPQQPPLALNTSPIALNTSPLPLPASSSMSMPMTAPRIVEPATASQFSRPAAPHLQTQTLEKIVTVPQVQMARQSMLPPVTTSAPSVATTYGVPPLPAAGSLPLRVGGPGVVMPTVVQQPPPAVVHNNGLIIQGGDAFAASSRSPSLRSRGPTIGQTTLSRW